MRNRIKKYHQVDSDFINQDINSGQNLSLLINFILKQLEISGILVILLKVFLQQRFVSGGWMDAKSLSLRDVKWNADVDRILSDFLDL